MSSIATITGLRRLITWKPSQGYRQVFLQNLLRKDPTQTDYGPASGCRLLYSASAMGIDGYASQRERTAIQFKDNRDKFYKRMNEVIESQTQGMIFTEDFKNAVHLAEPTEDELSLVMAMTKKFNSQHGGLRFGEYVFGPVVMRMFHHLDQPEPMLQALKMEEVDGFFYQISSYQLTMDLLYEHGRYQEVLDIFEDLQGKRINGIKYPKQCMTIAFAACYKMNTQASYEKMVEILKGAQEYGTSINIRCIMFAAALALNQNNPHIGLEFISLTYNLTQKVIRNLKVLSLIELGRVDEALPVLRSILQIDLPDNRRRGNSSQVFRETMNKVDHALKEAGNKELIVEFQRISKGLEDNGFITNETLDDWVCEPVKPFIKEDQHRHHENRHQDRAMLAASFNRDSRHLRQQKRRPFKPRPGLMEMD